MLKSFAKSKKMFLIVCLFAWCLMALSAQIGYIVPQSRKIYQVGPGHHTDT